MRVFYAYSSLHRVAGATQRVEQIFEKSLSEYAETLQKLKQLAKKAVHQRMESRYGYEDPESCTTTVSSTDSVIHEPVFRIIPSVISN